MLFSGCQHGLRGCVHLQTASRLQLCFLKVYHIVQVEKCECLVGCLGPKFWFPKLNLTIFTHEHDVDHIAPALHIHVID